MGASRFHFANECCVLFFAQLWRWRRTRGERYADLHTLNRYRDCLGASGPHDADRIRDLLQDILHWMAHQKPPHDYPAPIDTLREACDSACRDFPKEVAEEIDWAAFNRERGILIDKAVAGTITASEQKRLQEMQDFTDIYVERTAPRTYPDPEAKSK